MPTRTLGPGQCTEIATARQSSRADAVVMVEQTEADSSQVRVFTAAELDRTSGGKAPTSRPARRHARREVLNAAASERLPRWALLTFEVYARPRVAIFRQATRLSTRASRSSRTYLTTSTVHALGRHLRSAACRCLTARPSTRSRTYPAVDECLADGRSRVLGRQFPWRARLILDVLSEKGKVLFTASPSSRVSRPRSGRRWQPFFGMPGYPSSCLSNAHILLVPALRRLPAARTRSRRWTVPLAQRVVLFPRPATLLHGARGRWHAVPAFKASVTSPHVAGRWLHRDSVANRQSSRKGRSWRSRCLTSPNAKSPQRSAFQPRGVTFSLLRFKRTRSARQGTRPAAWDFLKRRLKELKLSEQGGILRTKANCLRICEGDRLRLSIPRRVVRRMRSSVLERIIPEHLIAPRSVTEHGSRRTPWSPIPDPKRRIPDPGSL